MSREQHGARPCNGKLRDNAEEQTDSAANTTDELPKHCAQGEVARRQRLHIARSHVCEVSRKGRTVAAESRPVVACVGMGGGTDGHPNWVVLKFNCENGGTVIRVDKAIGLYALEGYVLLQ